MPAGTRLREVNWSGKSPTTVISVNLPLGSLRALFGERVTGLDAAGGSHFGVIDPHIADLVQRLQVQAARGEPLGAAYIQGLSLTLASYVLGRDQEVARLAGDERDGGSFREVLVQFIDNNLDSNLGLVDLAHVVDYSPDHFSRLFKREFQIAPHQYLLLRRVERAKTLLLERQQPIAAIALACGFASQAHMNAVFKRLTGTTPGAFRFGARHSAPAESQFKNPER